MQVPSFRNLLSTFPDSLVAWLPWVYDVVPPQLRHPLTLVSFPSLRFQVWRGGFDFAGYQDWEQQLMRTVVMPCFRRDVQDPMHF
ncbi:hypothetical protein HYQ46_009780 [Verticillium longisporum]|nr:hypothetical protein HYQ46_009780 [Verticillium longisporum]